MADYLLPISDQDALSWIVAEQRTAVARHRRREAEAIQPGDRFYLYTTRGCFRNPTRDRGRLIGFARVTHAARLLDKPVRFGGREFEIEIRFRIESLAPRRSGVELGPMIDRLESFPKRHAWSGYIRRALVPLRPDDGSRIERALDGIGRDYEETRSTYSNRHR